MSSREKAESQVGFRTSAARKAELALLAKRLGLTPSELYRQILEDHIDEVRRRADERDRRPVITTTMVDRELDEFALDVNSDRKLCIDPSEVMGVRGLALLKLLDLAWGPGGPPEWLVEHVPLLAHRPAEPEPDATMPRPRPRRNP